MMIWWSALGNSKSLLPKSEELTLALSEEDTLPDPARPVMVTKKAVTARNRKRFDVHQEESLSKRVRRVPAKLLDWTICYHFGSFLYHCDFFMKYYTLCLWRLVPVFKCDSKLMDYLDCLMRDKQKESSGKVVQLVGLIFLLSFLASAISLLHTTAISRYRPNVISFKKLKKDLFLNAAWLLCWYS